MKKLGCLLLVFLLAAGVAAGLLAGGGRDFAGWGRKGDGTIHVQPEGKPEAGLLQDVEKAASAFNDLLQAGQGYEQQPPPAL